MRKIRLSDTDLELFDIEISPTDYTFYQRHKDAFKTMWKEQGKYFWIRFVITFRSFTIKHGVIKQMSIDSPKFQNLIDQAFIFIHEQFVDGKVSTAKNFLEDVAQLAQNQDKFPGLDSKSFSKDPFYARETRELFRKFFGMPDQKTSYLKVYILCPVYLRFGGSVCRCLIRWVDAENMDPSDDSYWTPPQQVIQQKNDNHDTCQHSMCTECNLDAESKFMSEIKYGWDKGPRFLDWWTQGDPRFVEPGNPLFSPHLNAKINWRKSCSLENYREFYQYTKLRFGGKKYDCHACCELRRNCERLISAYRATKKKAKKEGKEVGDMTEAQLLGCTCLHSTQSPSQQQLFPNTKDLPNPKKKDKKPPTKDNKSKDKKKPDMDSQDCNCPQASKPVFGDDACVTSDVELPLGCGHDMMASKVAGFKVIKIEDEKNGLFEVNVSVASLKSDAEESSHNESMKKKMKEQLLNTYILTADILRAKIDGLPRQMEWWEGRGFCIAVLNYEAEEREFTSKWSNFALKISGFDEVAIKQMMIKLLFYVSKRKRRTCYGWSMEVDDVVTCMLPEDSPNIGDLSISIQRGFRFEDRLVDEERDSLLKHQPNLRLDKVLMGMEAGDAAKLLKTDKDGEEKLKLVCAEIAGKELYGADLPVLDMEKLRKKLNHKTADAITEEQILWEQIQQDADKFEFYCLMDKARESEVWELGMKTIDVRYYLSHKNPTVKICPVCKIVDQGCNCLDPMITSPDIVKFMDKSDFHEIKLLGDSDGPELPKMSYKELNSFMMDDNDKDKDKKKKKGEAKKPKDKRIELTDLPMRFKEVGIVSEKTTISIPTKQDTPLIGKVPLDANDKANKMAPIPGLTSSLNFTFQNGKKEQTITVSLGAYMPEEKLNMITETKELAKLCTEEDRRHEIAHEKAHKKAEKKKKRAKSAKAKNSEKDQESPEKEDVTTKEKTAELTAMFLNEILGSPEANDAEKQLNAHLGLSHKKQQNQKKDSKIWAKYENRNGNKNDDDKQPDTVINGETDNAQLDDNSKEDADDAKTDVNVEASESKVKNAKTDENPEASEVKSKAKSDGKPEANEVKSKVKNAKSDVKQEPIEVKNKVKSDGKQEPTEVKSKVKSGGKQKATDVKRKVKSPKTDGKPVGSKINGKVKSPKANGEPDVTDLIVSRYKKEAEAAVMKVAQELEDIFRNAETGKKAETGSPVGEEHANEVGSGDKDTKTELKICWNCHIKEPRRKAFKKCQKCKEEGVVDCRYYCGRDCQVADWKMKHKQEHKDAVLK